MSSKHASPRASPRASRKGRKSKRGSKRGSRRASRVSRTPSKSPRASAASRQSVVEPPPDIHSLVQSTRKSISRRGSKPARNSMIAPAGGDDGGFLSFGNKASGPSASPSASPGAGASPRESMMLKISTPESVRGKKVSASGKKISARGLPKFMQKLYENPQKERREKAAEAIKKEEEVTGQSKRAPFVTMNTLMDVTLKQASAIALPMMGRAVTNPYINEELAAVPGNGDNPAHHMKSPMASISNILAPDVNIGRPDISCDPAAPEDVGEDLDDALMAVMRSASTLFTEPSVADKDVNSNDGNSSPYEENDIDSGSKDEHRIDVNSDNGDSDESEDGTSGSTNHDSVVDLMDEFIKGADEYKDGIKAMIPKAKAAEILNKLQRNVDEMGDNNALELDKDDIEALMGMIRQNSVDDPEVAFNNDNETEESDEEDEATRCCIKLCTGLTIFFALLAALFLYLWVTELTKVRSNDNTMKLLGLSKSDMKTIDWAERNDELLREILNYKGLMRADAAKIELKDQKITRLENEKKEDVSTIRDLTVAQRTSAYTQGRIKELTTQNTRKDRYVDNARKDLTQAESVNAVLRGELAEETRIKDLAIHSESSAKSQRKKANTDLTVANERITELTNHLMLQKPNAGSGAACSPAELKLAREDAARYKKASESLQKELEESEMVSSRVGDLESELSKLRKIIAGHNAAIGAVEKEKTALAGDREQARSALTDLQKVSADFQEQAQRNIFNFESKRAECAKANEQLDLLEQELAKRTAELGQMKDKQSATLLSSDDLKNAAIADTHGEAPNLAGMSDAEKVIALQKNAEVQNSICAMKLWKCFAHYQNMGKWFEKVNTFYRDISSTCIKKADKKRITDESKALNDKKLRLWSRRWYHEMPKNNELEPHILMKAIAALLYDPSEYSYVKDEEWRALHTYCAKDIPARLKEYDGAGKKRANLKVVGDIAKRNAPRDR